MYSGFLQIDKAVNLLQQVCLVDVIQKVTSRTCSRLVVRLEHVTR